MKMQILTTDFSEYLLGAYFLLFLIFIQLIVINYHLAKIREK